MTLAHPAAINANAPLVYDQTIDEDTFNVLGGFSGFSFMYWPTQNATRIMSNQTLRTAKIDRQLWQFIGSQKILMYKYIFIHVYLQTF